MVWSLLELSSTIPAGFFCDTRQFVLLVRRVSNLPSPGKSEELGHGMKPYNMALVLAALFASSLRDVRLALVYFVGNTGKTKTYARPSLTGRGQLRTYAA
jgi:hypothetical protein